MFEKKIDKLRIHFQFLSYFLHHPMCEFYSESTLPNQSYLKLNVR